MNEAAAQHRVEYPSQVATVSGKLTETREGQFSSQPAMKTPADIASAMRLVRMNVANARWWAFEDEAFRVASISYGIPARRTIIADFLLDLAVANGLVISHGEEVVHQVICAALRGDA